MKTSLRTLALAAVAAVAYSGAALAAGQSDIEYRQALMKAVGGHMTAMAKIMKDGAASMGDIPVHADAMAGLAKIAGRAFPAGSGPDAGKTKAKAEVWKKKAEFDKIMVTFEKDASALAAAAKSGNKDAIGKAMGALGKNACKACHETFREK